MIHWGCLLLAMSFGFKVGAAENVKMAQVDPQGQQVFSKIQPFAFKVKTSPNANSPQASYGTGFVVDTSGLLITNYHVVSESIIQPKKNKIFLMINDQPQAAEVVAIDLIHDLSLIRVKQTFPAAVKFAAKAPEQGAPIYSIGQPEDLNMAIVAGTYNGELTYGKYNIIHLSAPINSGMSGGPTVNANAEIIGVNVSKRLDASNLSFSVPARFAQELYEKNKNAPSHGVAFWEDMEKQLLNLQNSLTEEILESSKKTKSFHAWMVPDGAKTLKCWSVNDRNGEVEAQQYDSFGEICDLQHSSYISSDADSGSYKYSFTSVSNKKLNSWQFYKLLSNTSSRYAFSNFSFFRSDDKPKLFTKGDCVSDVVVSQSKQSFKVSYCLRGYTYFPQLQDARIVVTTLSAPPVGLSADIELSGFTSANIKKIANMFIESISRGEK